MAAQNFHTQIVNVWFGFYHFAKSNCWPCTVCVMCMETHRKKKFEFRTYISHELDVIWTFGHQIMHIYLYRLPWRGNIHSHRTCKQIKPDKRWTKLYVYITIRMMYRVCCLSLKCVYLGLFDIWIIIRWFETTLNTTSSHFC